MFIAAIGMLSVIAQTGLLTLLMKTVGAKHTIMIGLMFEMLQLMWSVTRYTLHTIHYT